jgi:predicted pyridoxine 5'-phosphate oxidase superfamily flavin-nucleotide-binding protein
LLAADIHMGILTGDMKRIVREQKLGYIATVCPDGTPNLSPKGTTAAWHGDYLVFADIRSPQSVQNIDHNPSVEVHVVDPFVARGIDSRGGGLSIARMKSSSSGARCAGTRDALLKSEPWS